MSDGNDFHWYLASGRGWNVAAADELPKGIRVRRREDGKGTPFLLFKVPGPTDREYRIEGFAPQVEGAEFVGRMNP